MLNHTCPHRHGCYSYSHTKCDGCNNCNTDYNTKPEPEKKMILVGTVNRNEAFEFMNGVVDELSKRSVNIIYIDHNRIRFKTPHTEVWFVWSTLHMRNLDGIRADGIFGKAYEGMLARAAKDAVISYRDHIGLVDYICQVEREVSESHRALAFGNAFAEGFEAGIYDSELRKRWMNSVYGRQNGKTQACLKYLERELGEIPEKQINFGGENNMNTIMSDILKNKLVYLTTESGSIPVKIESVHTSLDEPTQFEGRVLTAGEEYMRKDISGAQKLAAAMSAINTQLRNRRKTPSKLPGIKNVIFSGPCTIVIWEDGTKTVVRCNNDVLDPEKGLAMAIAKKALGTNKSGSNYYDIFKKWLPKHEVEEETVEED